jgi:hypothetical protein
MTKQIYSLLFAAIALGGVGCSDESDSIVKTPPQNNPTQNPGNNNGSGNNGNGGNVDPKAGTTTTPFSYETSAGSWKSVAQYTYDENGKVLTKYWETYTPAKRTGTDVYHYNAAGQITHIQRYDFVKDVYTWENQRIVRSERIDNGVVKHYNLYDYDEAGNVSGMAIYYRQPDGSYSLGFLKAYLYFNTGNLYKILTYVPKTGGEDEYTLLSTHTYDGYINSPNPFPAVEIIPGFKTQKNLATSFRIEEHGMNILYTMSYTFREDGYPLTRNVSSSYGSETTRYTYY